MLVIVRSYTHTHTHRFENILFVFYNLGGGEGDTRFTCMCNTDDRQFTAINLNWCAFLFFWGLRGVVLLNIICIIFIVHMYDVLLLKTYTVFGVFLCE